MNNVLQNINKYYKRLKLSRSLPLTGLLLSGSQHALQLGEQKQQQLAETPSAPKTTRGQTAGPGSAREAESHMTRGGGATTD